MSRARRNHHSPQVYLRNFADSDSLLMVYNRITQEAPRQIHTRHVAVEMDLYTVEDANGNKSDFFETGWLQFFDGELARILPKLLGHRPPLTDAERSLINMFMALQHMRTPFVRDTLANMTDLMLRVAVEQRTRGKSPKEIERFVEEWDPNASEKEKAQIRQIAIDPSQPVQWDAEPWIKAMLRHIPELAEDLETRKWTLVDAQDATFLTGDLPVVLDGPQALAIGEAPYIYWPLSPTRMLMLGPAGSHNGSSYSGGVAPPEVVHEVNQLTAARAARQIIWHPETDPTAGIELPVGAHTSQISWHPATVPMLEDAHMNPVNGITIATDERFYDIIHKIHEGLQHDRDNLSAQTTEPPTYESEPH